MAATETVIYNFCTSQNCLDGKSANAGFATINGILFSTNPGSTGAGQVYSIVPATGAFANIYNFCSKALCADGAGPTGDLIAVGSKLYGTTMEGGTGGCFSDSGCGTVYSLNPATGVEKVLHSFNNDGTDATLPISGVIDVKGTLYGTTFMGGANNAGAVFSVDARTGAEKVLHSFGSGTDGTYPQSGLVYVRGTLYGVTFGGGAGGLGALYAINPQTGSETVLYSFCSQANCTDGSFPEGNLINVKGTLYGVTGSGGANSSCTNCGTVFAFNLKHGAENAIYSFCSAQNCTGGYEPEELTAVNGALYGVTSLGGTAGDGTVFEVDPIARTEQVLHAFTGYPDDGTQPLGSLLYMNGDFYGATLKGGSGLCSGGCGTAFAISP